ncbi:MAG: hypothetical protein ACREJ4_13380 [Candidatus Methylomirabilaceae bacterium]
MYWNLVLSTAIWWALIGAVLGAAMHWGVTLSRRGWVRRRARWVKGLGLIVVAFALVFIGSASDFRTEELTLKPQTVALASRFFGALITAAAVYTYGFLQGWPGRLLSR